MKLINKYLSVYELIGAALGVTGGLIYFFKVGCLGESCPIWSSPWLSALWGGAMGYLLGGIVKGGSANFHKKKEESGQGSGPEKEAPPPEGNEH